MKIGTNRMMIGVSLLMMTFSLSFVTYAADACKKVPTCAELGYTDTWCDPDDPSNTKILKCPFDQSKLFCIYINESCSVGDIVYSDWTCSTTRHPTKTPIGVVGPSAEIIALNDLSSSTYTPAQAEDMCTKQKINGVPAGLHLESNASHLGNEIQYSQTMNIYNKIQNAMAAAGGTRLSGKYWSRIHFYNGSYSWGQIIDTNNNPLDTNTYSTNANDRAKVRCGIMPVTLNSNVSSLGIILRRSR